MTPSPKLRFRDHSKGGSLFLLKNYLERIIFLEGSKTGRLLRREPSWPFLASFPLPLTGVPMSILTPAIESVIAPRQTNPPRKTDSTHTLKLFFDIFSSPLSVNLMGFCLMIVFIYLNEYS